MTTAPAIDERQHSAAVIAAIKATLTALHQPIGENVFDHGNVPGQDTTPGQQLPETFVVIQIERRFVTATGLVSRPTRSGWRISAQHVSRTVNNARLAYLAVAQALDGQRFIIDGFTSTPTQLESSTAILPDSGVFSGSSVWTYAI